MIKKKDTAHPDFTTKREFIFEATQNYKENVGLLFDTIFPPSGMKYPFDLIMRDAKHFLLFSWVQVNFWGC